MKHPPVPLLVIVLSRGMLVFFSFSAIAQISPTDTTTRITFFDVSDLPARIDEPKLEKAKGLYSIQCAVANRSSEQLLGLRLEMLIIDRSGKLSRRIQWTEAAKLAAYSIETFTLNPSIKEDVSRTDRLFLIVDEVIGHDSIWQVAEADKTLRAYARGQHDAMPKVRKVENKFDRPNGILQIPIKR